MVEITPGPQVWADGVLLESLDPDTAHILQRLLLRIATAQDQIAADEAARIPYWKPCSHHVIGLRSAAATLRATAEAIVSR